MRGVSLFLALFCLTGALHGQVYSPNIVGYVNVPISKGYTFVSNPLDLDGTNSISGVLTPPPDGTQVYLWDVNNQVFTVPSVYSAAHTNWSTNYLLTVGRGFVVQSPTNWT